MGGGCRLAGGSREGEGPGRGVPHPSVAAGVPAGAGCGSLPGPGAAVAEEARGGGGCCGEGNGFARQQLAAARPFLWSGRQGGKAEPARWEHPEAGEAHLPLAGRGGREEGAELGESKEEGVGGAGVPPGCLPMSDSKERTALKLTSRMYLKLGCGAEPFQ